MAPPPPPTSFSARGRAGSFHDPRRGGRGGGPPRRKLPPRQPRPPAMPTTTLSTDPAGADGPAITIVPLGAGQDVGRSCIVVTFATGRTVMLDCGMHMGYSDKRQFPDFSYLQRGGDLTQALDAVLISHFHLDHCGALPYMTEQVGYDGHIIMSHPTKAICPILLEDFRRISFSKSGGGGGGGGGGGERGAGRDTAAASGGSPAGLHFKQEDILRCLSKVTCINVHQTIHLAPDLSVKAYYAGHVLGAVMFLVTSGRQSVLYTGDYNMTPDRHLGSAWVDKCAPDVLITESTYATTIRDSRRTRERDFLRKVHETLKAGGKVLVPVFAVGRAQELAILLEHYHERLELDAPMYFVGGLTAKSLVYYRLFLHWTNQKLRHVLLHGRRNPWDFKRIQSLRTDADLQRLDADGPMVVFSSPGMLHSGRSLEIFKKWAGSPKNMVILPGYCVPGTVGAHLLAQAPKGERQIPVPGATPGERASVTTRLKVENLSFSAHADAKGILALLRAAQPRSVVLVHGERKKMLHLRALVQARLRIPTHMPANLEHLCIRTPWAAAPPAAASAALYAHAIVEHARRFAAWAEDQARAGVAADPAGTRGLASLPDIVPPAAAGATAGNAAASSTGAAGAGGASGGAPIAGTSPVVGAGASGAGDMGVSAIKPEHTFPPNCVPLQAVWIAPPPMPASTPAPAPSADTAQPAASGATSAAAAGPSGAGASAAPPSAATGGGPTPVAFAQTTAPGQLQQPPHMMPPPPPPMARLLLPSEVRPSFGLAFVAATEPHFGEPAAAARALCDAKIAFLAPGTPPSVLYPAIELLAVLTAAEAGQKPDTPGAAADISVPATGTGPASAGTRCGVPVPQWALSASRAARDAAHILGPALELSWVCRGGADDDAGKALVAAAAAGASAPVSAGLGGNPALPQGLGLGSGAGAAGARGAARFGYWQIVGTSVEVHAGRVVWRSTRALDEAAAARILEVVGVGR